MFSMVNSKFQCANTTCLSFMNIITENVRNCQIVCLVQNQCKAATFYQSTKICNLFDDTLNQYGNLLIDADATSMNVIRGTRFPPESTLVTTTSTTTTIGTTTATTSTTTTTSTTATTSTTTTTTTTIINPCTTGNLRWNTTGITVTGIPSNAEASGLFVDTNDTLYSADENSNYVIWKLLNNAVNATVAAGLYQSTGSNSSQLSFPNDVYVDKNGDLYVVDDGNTRIQKFINGSRNGQTIAGVTQSGSCALNQFNSPRYFTFDATDTYMYISDCDCHRIMRYSTNSTGGSNGTVVAGGTGAYNQNTSLNTPWGIHYLPSVSNDLFITNYNGHSVIRWTPGASSGIFIAGIPGVAGSNSTLLNQPMGIRIDTYSNVYVVDRNNHRVQLFCANNKTGITIAGTGVAGNSNTQLNGPRGIAFDSAMNMYIGDLNNHRVQKFVKL